MAPISFDDVAIATLHGSGGLGVVAMAVEDQELFNTFDSYQELVEDVGRQHSVDGGETYDAGVICVGRLKPERIGASPLSAEEVERVRLVFAAVTKDTAGHYTGCVLFGGFVSEEGTVAEADLLVGGRFLPIVEIRDWRRVQWELRLLDRDGGGKAKLDTELPVIRRRILRELLLLKGEDLVSGWGTLAKQPRMGWRSM